jgi:hypothetical protein
VQGCQPPGNTKIRPAQEKRIFSGLGPFPNAMDDGISELNLSPAVVKGELRDAYFTLSSHGLLHSAKWVAEQAAGIGKGVKAVLPSNSNSNFENDEDDAIVLGKAFFDVREYRYEYLTS